MENEIQLFSFDNQQVRTLVINDQPYFVGKDVAEILGYGDTNQAIRKHVDDEDKLTRQVDGSGQNRAMTVINESGLYDLIFDASRQSKNPDIQKRAKKFRHWVTADVLPSIRKHGVYMTDQKAYDITHSKDALADLLIQAGQQIKEKNLIIEEMKPKAIFADAVSASDTPVLIGELAKVLKQNNINTLDVNGKAYSMGPNNLFKWLRSNGYLISRKGTDYNTPTQRSMKMGLFKIKESTHVAGDGSVHISKTSKVTGKGQIYFVNKFKKEA